jgi:hypothetical protein
MIGWTCANRYDDETSHKHSQSFADGRETPLEQCNLPWMSERFEFASTSAPNPRLALIYSFPRCLSYSVEFQKFVGGRDRCR